MAIETTYMILNSKGEYITYGTYQYCKSERERIMYGFGWSIMDWCKKGYSIKSIYDIN